MSHLELTRFLEIHQTWLEFWAELHGLGKRDKPGCTELTGELDWAEESFGEQWQAKMC